jgi:hypothetical protein
MTLTVLSLINGLASMAYGDKAVMNKSEREMISEPLERILSRMDNVTKGFLTKYADPFLLITGLIAWGSRIRREAIQRQEDEAKNLETGVEKVQEIMPKNSKHKIPEAVADKPFDYSRMNVNLPMGGV